MMTSTIDDTGLALFLDLHLSFRSQNTSFTQHQQEHYFRALYELIPDAARDLWCAEESLEYFDPPYHAWRTELEHVKEFWRLRSMVSGPTWTDEEKSGMDDPGFSLFVRRHGEVNALEEEGGWGAVGLDYRGYGRSLGETWEMVGEDVQALWRSDATGMIDTPRTPITDPAELWAECRYQVPVREAEENDVFEAQGPHVKNYWIFKAFEESKLRLDACALGVVFEDGYTESSLAMPKPIRPIPIPSLLTPYHHNTEHPVEPSQEEHESQRLAILAWYFSTGHPVECPCGRAFRETAALRNHRRQRRCKSGIVEEPKTDYRWECPAVVRGVRCGFGNTRVQFMMRHLRRDHGVVFPPR